MTPEQQAVAIHQKFFQGIDLDKTNMERVTFLHAKEAALIAVDLLISEAEGGTYRMGREQLSNVEYWTAVRDVLKNM